MGIGPDTIPLDLARTTLSQCSTFQIWTGAADAAAALAFIHLLETPDKPVFPLAVIGFGQTRSTNRIATGNAFESNGSVKISFQGPLIPGQSRAATLSDTADTLSEIMDREFLAQAAQVGFNISGHERNEYPQLIAEKESPDLGYGVEQSFDVLYID